MTDSVTTPARRQSHYERGEAVERRQKGTGSVTRLKSGKWRGSFEAGYTPSGGRRRVSVTASTEAAAKRKLQQKLRNYNLQGLAAVKRSYTVKAWVEQWIASERGRLRPATLRKYESRKRHIVAAVGKKQLAALTPEDMRHLVAYCQQVGISASTTRDVYGLLVRALRAAVVEGHQVPQPVLMMRPPSPDRVRREAIPLPDARRLAVYAWQHAGDGEHAPDTSRWVAALLQGMRQGEALGLTWDRIDWDAGLIVIDRQLQRIADPSAIPASMEAEHLEGQYYLTSPKTTRGQRVIPMIEPMRTALERWRTVAPPSPYGLVWARRSGGPASARTDRKQWQTLQEALGVAREDGSHYVVHEARHTTATLLLDAGVDPVVITAIMGHSTMATSRGYMTVSRDMAARALEGVAERLELG